MSYAVLSEVWPDFNPTNKFKKYQNTLPQHIVENLIETAETRGGNKYFKSNVDTKQNIEPVMYEKSRDYPIDKKEDEPRVPIEKFSNVFYGKYHSECSTILKHLSTCMKCREFLQKKFTPEKSTEQIEKEETNDEYLDLAIYIVTGIFVLFILDMLMKFSRRNR